VPSPNAARSRWESDLQPAGQRGLPGYEIPCPTSHAVFTTLHERAFDLHLGFQKMFPLIPRGIPHRMKEGRIKPEFEFASCVATLVPGRRRNRTFAVRDGSAGAGARVKRRRCAVKNRSPAIGRRHANTATGSPEHPSNTQAVPRGRRSILVNPTEPRNAYNQYVSHVRDGSIFPSPMAGRRHNSRLPSPVLS
jgi:hypothetical protein